jgi:hypothetical protein
MATVGTFLCRRGRVSADRADETMFAIALGRRS